jgi:hypothetical protein
MGFGFAGMRGTGTDRIFDKLGAGTAGFSGLSIARVDSDGFIDGAPAGWYSSGNMATAAIAIVVTAIAGNQRAGRRRSPSTLARIRVARRGGTFISW